HVLCRTDSRLVDLLEVIRNDLVGASWIVPRAPWPVLFFRDAAHCSLMCCFHRSGVAHRHVDDMDGSAKRRPLRSRKNNTGHDAVSIVPAAFSSDLPLVER